MQLPRNRKYNLGILGAVLVVLAAVVAIIWPERADQIRDLGVALAGLLHAGASPSVLDESGEKAHRGTQYDLMLCGQEEEVAMVWTNRGEDSEDVDTAERPDWGDDIPDSLLPRPDGFPPVGDVRALRDQVHRRSPSRDGLTVVRADRTRISPDEVVIGARSGRRLTEELNPSMKQTMDNTTAASLLLVGIFHSISTMFDGKRGWKGGWRLHSALDFQPPVEFEEQLARSRTS